MRTIVFFFMLTPPLVNAQVGNPFPVMQTESLTNRSVNIPEDVSDKYTLIGLAYSKKSEQSLKTWFRPTYTHFIHKPDKPSLFSGRYDVNVYFIPMFTGAKRPAYQKVMKKVKKTVDPRLQPHVMFYKGNLKTYKKALNFKGKDVPYFFIIDTSGHIVYTTSGRYTEEKMRQIANVIEDAWE